MCLIFSFGTAAQTKDDSPLDEEAVSALVDELNNTGLVWQPQREIFNRMLQSEDLNKCYRVTGTTLGSSYDNSCQ
jgi:hypothetical protein